jgi:hypothetical protein
MGCEGFLKRNAEMLRARRETRRCEEGRILNVQCCILKGAGVLDLPQRREGRGGTRRFFEAKRGGAEDAEEDTEIGRRSNIEY